MNEQFSIIYTLLFLSAIIGSFVALKEGINYWAEYKLFLIDSNELVSSLELANYFDIYNYSLNFSNNLTINANSSTIQLSRNNYYINFNNSVKLKQLIINNKDFLILKNMDELVIE